jgi:hypothetical protein
LGKQYVYVVKVSPLRVMQTQKQSEDEAALVFDIVARCNWEVNAITWPLFPREWDASFFVKEIG